MIPIKFSGMLISNFYEFQELMWYRLKNYKDAERTRVQKPDSPGRQSSSHTPGGRLVLKENMSGF